MTNYFELFDKRLSAIEANQQEILSRLSSATGDVDEVGGIDLAARVTQLSKPRIYALVSERAIPHNKRGNRLYFSRAELLSWIAAGKRKTVEEGATA